MFFTLPQPGDDGKTIRLSFDTAIQKRFLPAEWYTQSGVQLTWPHKDTDWAYMLEEVQACFVNIAGEISKREKVLIVTPDIEDVKRQVEGKVNMENVVFFSCETNDTWARDHAFITMMGDENPLLLDFKFNGWGEKFEAVLDNAINKQLYKSGIVKGDYGDHSSFILEGGSIESDGKGSILTTESCLLASHRNQPLNKMDIEERLKNFFQADQILWLKHGHLSGDDTDGHIDTLARFCPNDTIAYVQCTDKNDGHYEALLKMEEELKELRTLDKRLYRLLPLPMTDAIYENEERLPATYANFLVINGAVLYPTYNQPEKDAKAGDVLKQAFPKEEIIGIDCRALIKQHGSLHCVTMQYPAGIIQS